MGSPLEDPKSSKQHLMKILDEVFTAIFVAEMMIKIFAKGFVLNGKNSYLRNGWNILDFLIVMASISSLFSQLDAWSIFKVLRMLRVLRPLRLVSHNKGLKLSIICLMKSLPSIMNLMLVVVFFLFLIGILGTTLFGGKFWHCHTEDMIAEEEGKALVSQNSYFAN
jgi:hypothetical protein